MYVLDYIDRKHMVTDKICFVRVHTFSVLQWLVNDKSEL